MLIRFKINRDNGVSIIDNGKAYIFNSSGMYEKEEVLNPKRLDGIQNLPVISIITSNSHTDIMAHTQNDEELFYTSSESGMSCASTLVSSGDFVRMLRRNGKLENTLYNQVIFVYREDINLQSKLSLLNIRGRD